MKRVFTVEEMRFIDSETLIHENITKLQLVEQSGLKLYEELKKVISFETYRGTIILIGTGLNGADGLILGLQLMKTMDVRFIVVNEGEPIAKETDAILKWAIEQQGNVLRLNSVLELETYLSSDHIIIDSLFGTGLSHPVKGLYKEVIEAVNNSLCYTISIDIPSGLNGNTGNIEGTAIKANLTAIMQSYKVGNLLNDALDHHGEQLIVDLGMDESVIANERYFIQMGDVRHLLPKRKHNTHKYHYGNVLTIGGSIGMTGAPLLTAYSALRTGSGLSALGVNQRYYQRLVSPFLELMVSPYETQEELIALCEKRHAIAFGPGLGRKDEENVYVLETLLELERPLLIDADGLYYLKQRMESCQHQKIVITPHRGEMAMMLGVDVEVVNQNPLAALRYLTDHTSLTVVLKGACTVIANQEVTYFCTAGNPGMATAGSGDVLTGIILSLLGQGLTPCDASIIGVLLHGECGDIKVREFGQASLIASDLIEAIPQVLHR